MNQPKLEFDNIEVISGKNSQDRMTLEEYFQYLNTSKTIKKTISGASIGTVKQTAAESSFKSQKSIEIEEEYDEDDGDSVIEEEDYQKSEGSSNDEKYEKSTAEESDDEDEENPEEQRIPVKSDDMRSQNLCQQSSLNSKILNQFVKKKAEESEKKVELKMTYLFHIMVISIGFMEINIVLF